MKSLRFKLDTSLDIRKPMKERTSVIISLEFVRFISITPDIEKLFSDLN